MKGLLIGLLVLALVVLAGVALYGLFIRSIVENAHLDGDHVHAIVTMAVYPGYLTAATRAARYGGC